MSDITAENTRPAAAVTDADALINQLQSWIDEVQSNSDRRRIKDRFFISCTLQLTPMDREGNLLGSELLGVIGKDLSTAGIAISHTAPLSCRRAVISFIHAKVGCFVVEVEVVWSRKTNIGIYESGCRLIRKLPEHEVRVSQ